jgi:hypothetical protein
MKSKRFSVEQIVGVLKQDAFQFRADGERVSGFTDRRFCLPQYR